MWNQQWKTVNEAVCTQVNYHAWGGGRNNHRNTLNSSNSPHPCFLHSSCCLQFFWFDSSRGGSSRAKELNHSSHAAQRDALRGAAEPPPASPSAATSRVPANKVLPTSSPGGTRPCHSGWHEGLLTEQELWWWWDHRRQSPPPVLQQPLSRCNSWGWTLLSSSSTARNYWCSSLQRPQQQSHLWGKCRSAQWRTCNK